MSLCINPACSQPQNVDQPMFCQSCGSEVLLQGIYRATRQLGQGGFGTTYEVSECGVPKVLKVLHETHPKAVILVIPALVFLMTLLGKGETYTLHDKVSQTKVVRRKKVMA
ncbi:MAG: 4-Cys prefix domain-containing protein [Leptolyngbyaceae cyanobacterium]